VDFFSYAYRDLTSVIGTVTRVPALEHLGDYVAIRFGKGSKEARKFYALAARHLLGKSFKAKQKSKKRKGHKKHRRVQSASSTTIQTYADDKLSPRRMTGWEKVLEMLILDEPETPKQREVRDALVNYIEENSYRMGHTLLHKCNVFD